MDDKQRLQLQNMIKANNVEDQTRPTGQDVEYPCAKAVGGSGYRARACHTCGGEVDRRAAIRCGQVWAIVPRPSAGEVKLSCRT